MARSSKRPAARPAVRRRWWIAAAGVAGTAALTAVGTLTGKIVLWNVDQGRAEAEQTVITAADQDVEPYAVVGDRFVLYSVRSSQSGPAQLQGPLSVWDTHSRTTTELWACPDGCEIRTVARLPGTDRLLIYAAKPGGDDPTLWTATLRHP
jgi:hypothetical protein